LIATAASLALLRGRVTIGVRAVPAPIRSPNFVGLATPRIAIVIIWCRFEVEA
jgi:hypothetical protein